jgi:carboxypeptidase Taq
MKIDEAYDDLSTGSKEMTYLSSAVGLLHWDQRTNIPPRGQPYRIDQLAAFARILHQRMTDPKIGELLAVVEQSDLVKDPLSVQAVNIREWRRSYDRVTRVPEDLAVEVARATAEGQSVWEKARPENDWSLFEPCLGRIISLKREVADALGYDNERYDALADYYEPDATARELEPVLRKLAEPLVELLERIQASPKAGHEDLPNPHFPVPEQQALAREVALQLGSVSSSIYRRNRPR